VCVVGGRGAYYNNSVPGTKTRIFICHMMIYLTTCETHKQIGLLDTPSRLDHILEVNSFVKRVPAPSPKKIASDSSPLVSYTPYKAGTICTFHFFFKEISNSKFCTGKKL